SAVSRTKAPIVFIGVGEHLEDLDPFIPSRFISRMLGMGDLQSLMETAKDSISEEQAMETTKRIMSGKFSLREMYDQMEMLTSMGPLKKLMAMLPGMGAGLDEKIDIEETQERLRRYRTIMDSMTEEEMENPKLIKSSRVMRIARGSGMDPKNVRELLQQYNSSKKAVKGFMGNRKLRKQLMKQMQGGGFEGLQ
ncbi:MAG: signal recognition particle protein Srp19, partial [Methanomassiliicoccales archaeon]|nr:signal recognition particle protein Srp19 [Methanomassiliicoccales archaeon]